MMVFLGTVTIHAEYGEWVYKSWVKEVKKYTSEPSFSNMPDNILEAYRFVWDEAMDGYTVYIRISKIMNNDQIIYQLDGANIGYYTMKKRIRAQITKQEWEKLKNSINVVLSYNYLGARDERRVYDAGTVITEIYRGGKNCYLWRYNALFKRDGEDIQIYLKTLSRIRKFYYQDIVNNKHRDKQVYDLQKELDEKKEFAEMQRQKKYEEEAKKRQAIYESKRLWESAQTGAVGGIGYFKNMNANIKNEKGQTPLMVAVKNGHTDVVRALSEAVVNVHEEDYEGKTAFDYIKMPTSREEDMYSRRMYGALRILEVFQIIKGKAKIVQYRYKNDLDVLKITIKGKSCDSFLFPKNTYCKTIGEPKNINKDIFKAIKEHNNTTFDNLVSTIDLEMKDKSNYSLLWQAIISKNLYAVNQLLQQGAEINGKDNNNHHTPIYYATINNDVELLKVLLQNGVDVNSKNQFGSYVLSTAMQGCDNFEAIALLLDNGANPYLKDRWGQTVLDKKPTFCKDKENIEKMKKLLKERSAFSPE